MTENNDANSHGTKFGEGTRVDPDEAEKARAKKEKERQEKQDEKKYKLRGANGADFANSANGAGLDSILSNRWLCRGCGAFIVAPSGQGKSTLTIQAAASFACGIEAFGLKPSIMPLRSTIIQAEDNRGDLSEMWQVINHMGLSAAQKQLVAQNTWVETVNNKRGKDFTKALDEILTQKPCDLCWINPYAVYMRGSIRDDDANNEFLYERLNPILEEHKCAAAILAHTPKTQFRDTSKFKSTDWMYAGAGAAVLTQWARGIIVIDPTDVAGVYRFIAAKREKRLAWPENQLYFAHSGEGKLLWVPASKEQKRAASDAAKNTKSVNLERALELVPVLDPELKTVVESRIRSTLNVGRNLVKEALSILQFEQKIFTRYMDNPANNGKKGRPFEGWSQTPEVNDPF